MQLRTFQEPLEEVRQLSTMKELYSYSLESHTLKVIQQLTDGSMSIEDSSAHAELLARDNALV